MRWLAGLVALLALVGAEARAATWTCAGGTAIDGATFMALVNCK